MTTKQTIIQRLQEDHPGKWVADIHAIRHFSIEEGMPALKSLASDGIIERTTIGGYPYVRYTPPYRQLKAIKC